MKGDLDKPLLAVCMGISLVLFLALIHISFDLGGSALVIEFFMTFLLIGVLAGVVFAMYLTRSFFAVGFVFLFGLHLVNVLLLYSGFGISGYEAFVLSGTSMIGLVASLGYLIAPYVDDYAFDSSAVQSAYAVSDSRIMLADEFEKKYTVNNPHVRVNGEDIRMELATRMGASNVESMKSSVSSVVRSTKSSHASRVVKTYSPGLYVGSKSGKTYHSPKCDWAKKIRKENQVWFKTKKAAEKRGYVPHYCVK